MQTKISETTPCPFCSGFGRNAKTGGTCSKCNGSGQLRNFFPFPYHYPIPLVVVAPNLPAAYSPPVLTVPQAPPNPYIQGINPVTLKMGADNPFKWIFTLLSVTSPTVVGDASAWLQLFLQDLQAGPNSNFQTAPVVASLYGGDGKNPFPILETPIFGENTQLLLQGYPILITGNQVGLGVGSGGAATYNFTLNGPVLPGSVVLLVNNVSAATDDGAGKIAGAGITGVINYTTGVGSVTITTAFNMVVTSTQGPAQINCQLDLQGSYLRRIKQPAA